MLVLFSAGFRKGYQQLVHQGGRRECSTGGLAHRLAARGEQDIRNIQSKTTIGGYKKGWLLSKLEKILRTTTDAQFLNNNNNNKGS
mmetsp:Transcript_11039/g.22868  ORF Transcript_11039/g.22868 Transcript_11039/m.22868 type:complete len:86 (-) Transcript_11039:206-463(-)